MVRKPAHKSAVHKSIPLLNRFLANTYILYVKTQNFHWNVEDPRFFSLHKFFEEQYENLADATDEIAERIRMLGGVAPASLHEFLEFATLKDAIGMRPGNQMLKELFVDHERMIDECHSDIRKMEEYEDDGSADLLIQRLRYHEKTAWMLRSHFPGK